MPDLTPGEQETARAVREVLVARRKAGEANITIRKGKIVALDSGVHLGRGQKSSVILGATTSTPGLVRVS